MYKPKEPVIESVVIPEGIECVGSDVFTDNPITRITLPANVSDTHLQNYGFATNFRTFYTSQNKVAGTYTRNGPIWSRSAAGGVD